MKKLIIFGLIAVFFSFASHVFAGEIEVYSGSVKVTFEDETKRTITPDDETVNIDDAKLENVTIQVYGATSFTINGIFIRNQNDDERLLLEIINGTINVVKGRCLVGTEDPQVATPKSVPFSLTTGAPPIGREPYAQVETGDEARGSAEGAKYDQIGMNVQAEQRGSET